MTGKARPALSLSERASIAAEIARAENATSGEIVVLVATRSGLYRSAAPVLALLCALATPWPLIAFTVLPAAWIAAIQAAIALAALLIAMNERVRTGLVPPTIRRHRVRDAARREFDARGLASTEGRTGVLIYVALAERHAEIVADTAVRARIADEAWGEVLEELTEAAARGALGPGLLATVGRVGSMLADALPAGPNRNELPNRVVLLD
ncbi:hypothetical protein HCU64_11420 [Methylobacterium sp. C25]|uniref:TPM domain-containing protein n=1 Tax=Methylobacterium sp. C25 TaxID=2721622 RepID=UPI001F2A5557|nr:TPM domain-containing protein [Methylobacterium sp. C25]MCE4224362.1 hypothetical protein [Methylobacterium sp. C25]